MTRTVIYMERAREDLIEIRRWLNQPGSGPGARRRIQAILAALDELSLAPCRFRRGAYPGTRELMVQRHVVIYRVVPDTGDNETAGDILVLRIFGPGQERWL